MSEPENNPPQPAEFAPNQDAPPVSTINGATPRPVFMPETFTGAGREWSDWAEQFEMAADVNNWDESLRLKFMGLLLAGRAREVYSGLSAAAKTNYTLLKDAMGRCLDPCDSDDWNRASFSSRRRLHNETVREFGIALRRLVARAYPSADLNTQDLLARDHFITHVGSGDLRISLRSAKPATLEAAINLASELELIRGLENSHLTQDAKVRGVSEPKSKSDEQMEVLLGVVEGLRQEVKVLQTAVHAFKSNLVHPVPVQAAAPPPPPQAVGTPGNVTVKREAMEQRGGCWECGCNRHIRRNCPYLQGN
ncbi:uncharacterized protein LOC115364535 [Myripristis murdjan]|uniref:uncharacterized protein LOC115364535 n=1 Tax=Myripristis murdjan TaxID=586833 RepID=UPI001176277E|nr:uncharacterized protein LOC115364535 [Myripristis murdjan]